MNARHPAQRLGAREEFRLGALRVQLIPHCLPGVGPRVFVTLTESPESWVGNLAPAQLRELADRLKLAACEAEVLARRARPAEAATPDAPPAPRAEPVIRMSSPGPARRDGHQEVSIFLRKQAD